jgi:hypothetical protein
MLPRFSGCGCAIAIRSGLSGSSEGPIPDWAVLEYLRELGEIAVAGEDIHERLFG